jgi:hypothetical protein
MRKGIIAFAGVIAMTFTVVSCDLFGTKPVPKPTVDSPKTIVDSTIKDSGKTVIDSTKK